jgi:small ligand-binding sensory domain FIST
MQLPFSSFAIALLTLPTSVVTAYQVTPNGNADPPPIASNAKQLLLEEQLSSNAGIRSLTAQSFMCTQAISKQGVIQYQSALNDLLADWNPPSSDTNSQVAFGCLFVGPSFASNLENLVKSAQEKLGEQTQLLTVVGGGVIGDGQETENSCGMAFFGGILPEESSVELFSVTDGTDTKSDGLTTTIMESSSKFRESSSSKNEQKQQHQIRKPSHLVFADPHCHAIHSVMEELDGIVAGGISVAKPSQSSLAVGPKVLPPGSLVGATFTGTVGLQVVVTQGCRPVGSTFRVTSVDGPAVHELDCERAIDKLQEIMNEVIADSNEDAAAGTGAAKIQSDDFLGGIHKDEQTQQHGIRSIQQDANEKSPSPPDEFILRQMTGFRPRSGSILVCGPQIQEGDYFRFHVQSKDIALEDWRKTLERAGTERLFLGEKAGKALGALQISCMGRGESLFGIPNVDLRHVERLLPPNTPVAGLMANAEIGPVGIRLGAPETCRSVLHGFASVVAMLCDYSDTEVESSSASCLGNSTDIGAWD